jgi:hypothetical protein
MTILANLSPVISGLIATATLVVIDSANVAFPFVTNIATLDKNGE